MEASWSQRFHDLTPEAQLVIRTCAIFGRTPLSQYAAAAALSTPLTAVGDVFTALVDAGWGEAVDDQLGVRFVVDPDSLVFLYRLVRQTSLDDVQAIIERVAASVENVLTGGSPLSRAVQDNVLGVLRAANWHDMPQNALSLAHAVWKTLLPEGGGAEVTGADTGGVGIDMVWWRAVAEEGEQAASRTRQPHVLVDLLDHSARLYSAAGDWQGAEAALIRAAYLMNRLGDGDEYDRYLELLATTYHDAGQATAFVTTLEELVDRYERDGKPDRAASALVRIGATLRGTGQFASAIRYLEQADRLLADLPETNDLRTRRAKVLSDIGRVHAGRGAINSARTYYRDALVLVVDIDHEAERYVRELQASLPSGSPD